MKINEFDNEVTQKELDMLETYIDKAFNKIGIDVEFTRHFLDRVNDERNIRQITIKELGMLFAKEYKRWGKPIAQLGPDAEAVMKDISSDINIPFALKWDRNNNQLELVAKTVMRKKNFKTPNKEFPVESIEEHDDPSSYVKTIRKAGYSIYVSKIAGGEGGQRFEVETPSGKEFEVIERETGHYELFANGPTMSGKGEVFGSLMDAIRAAETANEAVSPSRKAMNENQSSLEAKIDDAYEYFDRNPAKDSLDAILIFEKNDTFQSVHNRNSYRHTLEDEGWQLVCIVNADRRLQLAKKYEYIRTNENINEDLGSIPALTDLIVMAVVGQTTVAALKGAYKSGKYALKLKKLADKAGVKLNNAVMGESNPFTDARMNAIKAGKKNFIVKGKKYKVTGDTSDEQAVANEAINRDEYIAKLAVKAQDKFMHAALGALDRLVKSDPRGQDVGGYAFDIARAFQGVNARELERLYTGSHRKK